uniref:Uncharacterized protein n=1 Tax=Anguilla anguilla TaxID=7936 RepID=A0A0E9UEM9_ANGAN
MCGQKICRNCVMLLSKHAPKSQSKVFRNFC